MKTRYFFFAAVAVLALAACRKEDPAILPSEHDFGFNVRNEDYEAEYELKGLGEATLLQADNLPGWIAGVTLKEELSSQGDPVAVISVKGDYALEEEREAKVVLKLFGGRSVTLHITQWPILKPGTNEGYQSVNKEFEADWASAREIVLVTKNVDINGRPEIRTVTVSLPWDWEHLPSSYLPKGDGTDEGREINKMITNKGDWSLVFNLTGIMARPNYNWFGLYNRYSGILRIFYYFTEEMIPDNETSDHMWSFALNANLAEHLATQFALPSSIPASQAFKAMASRPVLTTPTTDSYNPLHPKTDPVSGKKESTTPKVGWWAFDVNLAAYREHDFFAEKPQVAANIELYTYGSESVLLNSVLQGSVTGKLQGKMNLDLLAPTSTPTWAKIVSPLLSTAGGFLSHNYWLKDVIGGAPAAQGGPGREADERGDVQVEQAPEPAPNGLKNTLSRYETKSVTVGVISFSIGMAATLAGKFIDNFAKKKIQDQNFGALNCSVDLDLNAVMTTEGTIVGDRTNKVPQAEMSMDYFMKENPDGTPTSLGKGIWNLENHPVVYVVKDAFWCENNFSAISVNKTEYRAYGEDIYSYDLGATKGSRPGLRLITFLDPTSIGGVRFNKDLFDQEFSRLRVYLSYGIYPGSDPGYTDAFRQAAGLDYQRSWHLSEKSSFNSGTELKLIKKPHTDPLFDWTAVADEMAEVAGLRLSTQKVYATKYPTLERRYYGLSMYYSNPYASAFDVDQVQFVYDPQIYVPFEEAGHKLFDPQVPDLVVSAAIGAYGLDNKDNGEPATLTNTLRFLPRIVYISYKDLPRIYQEIEYRKNHMPSCGALETIYAELEYQVSHIKDIVDAVK